MNTILNFIRSRRFHRILIWTGVSLLTLTALLYVWTNWSGRRRWAAAQALVKAEGETLDFHKLLPETPPEAKNLLAIAPLRGLAEDAAPGVAQRQALEAVKWSSSKPAPAASGVALGRTADFQEWVTFLRESKYLDLPAGRTVSGKEVLSALDAKAPLLKQITDEVPGRPLAMFTPGLREREMPEMLFTLKLPHYQAAQSLAKALALRARAAVAAGESAEAARSILAIHRLAAASEQEPLLIGFLVGNSLEMQALECLWLGLRERMFAAEDLKQLQDAFATNPTTANALLAMRGELAAGLNAMEFLQLAASGQRTMDEDLRKNLAIDGLAVGRYLGRLLPGGLFDHWKSTMVEAEMRHLIQPLKKGGLRELQSRGDAMSAEIKQNANVLLHPDYLFARLILPAVGTVSSHALLLDARRQQVLAALALERFFGKHAHYPAALAELTPEFLPAVPADPCDGKPMRYRLTPAGRYLLWSVGFDGKDDNGRVASDARNAGKLNKPQYLGDWTWQYEPVK